MFLPYQGILIPLVQTLQFFHVYATLPGVILGTTTWSGWSC
jgi:ABC-type glycerol-3-phosphate transport system permease component